jgi:hypothetical protein
MSDTVLNGVRMVKIPRLRRYLTWYLEKYDLFLMILRKPILADVDAAGREEDQAQRQVFSAQRTARDRKI